MTPAALEHVQTALEQGELATIEQARQYVAIHDQIVYTSLHGVYRVLRKPHITKKTGRRRHAKASADAQQAFTKTSSAERAARMSSSPLTKAALGATPGAGGAGAHGANGRHGSSRRSTNGSGSMAPSIR
jgi:hypothetical protein